jgi:hypothetical protein
VLLLAAAVAAPAARATEPVPGAAELLRWVRDLSDPAMEGRAAGSAGGDRAIRYLASEFRRLGLEPAGDAGTYYQAFRVLTGLRVGPGTALEPTGAVVPGVLAADSAFRPLGFSDEGEVEAPLVFAGYGLSAPAVPYDDYADVDARGKVVLVMAGEPRAAESDRPFRAPERAAATRLRAKAVNAREHGARAVLVVAPPGRDDRLVALHVDPPAAGLLALTVRRDVADALLAAAGLSLADLHAGIERTLQPASHALPGVTVRVAVAFEREHATTANVIGRVRGVDPAAADEMVVVGAHHDGLGRGGPTSLAPEQAGTIHPGADDNASGTAALLGIADALRRAGAPRRSVVLAAFGAEEIGLLGSAYYVSRRPAELDRTVAMVNLDTVGRLRDGGLSVMGLDTGHGLRALVERATAGASVPLRLEGGGSGPSDHAVFLRRERPVVFFFTGVNGDYHRPSDTWERIDADGLHAVAALAYRVVRALADAPVAPAFVRVPAGAR